MTAMLTRTKFLASKGIQAAIIASPIFFAVAPSQAAITKTFNGFTQAFAPGKFDITTTPDGTADFTPTTLTLVRNRTAGTTPDVSYLINSAFMETFKPAGAGNVKFLSGVYSYDWNITSGTQVGGGALNAYNFSQTESGQTPIKFAYPATPPTSGALNIATGTGANIAPELVDTSKFGWFLTKSNNQGKDPTNATATISNFVFTATYETVPGPLPLAGAAAAFAWSRRLRRRLKTAQTSI